MTNELQSKTEPQFNASDQNTEPKVAGNINKIILALCEDSPSYVVVELGVTDLQLESWKKLKNLWCYNCTNRIFLYRTFLSDFSLISRF